MKKKQAIALLLATVLAGNVKILFRSTTQDLSQSTERYRSKSQDR